MSDSDAFKKSTNFQKKIEKSLTPAIKFQTSIEQNERFKKSMDFSNKIQIQLAPTKMLLLKVQSLNLSASTIDALQKAAQMQQNLSNKLDKMYSSVVTESDYLDNGFENSDENFEELLTQAEESIDEATLSDEKREELASRFYSLSERLSESLPITDEETTATVDKPNKINERAKHDGQDNSDDSDESIESLIQAIITPFSDKNWLAKESSSYIFTFLVDSITQLVSLSLNGKLDIPITIVLIRLVLMIFKPKK